MHAPLLIVHATQNGEPGPILTLDQSRVAEGLWTSTMPTGFSNTIQLLGSGETPGVLQPGESFRIPVYYAGWQQPWDMSYPPFYFSLSVVTEEGQEYVEWDAIDGTLRPSHIPDEAWSAISENLWNQLGGRTGIFRYESCGRLCEIRIETKPALWPGDYVRVLNENARYLAQLGLNVRDVDELWAFEFAQAYGFRQLSLVEPISDPRLVTPGLPLNFQLYYDGSILGRNDVTTAGRGWYHNWGAELAVETDSTVVVTNPYGFERRFEPDLRGGLSHKERRAAERRDSFGVWKPAIGSIDRRPAFSSHRWR